MKGLRVFLVAQILWATMVVAQPLELQDAHIESQAGGTMLRSKIETLIHEATEPVWVAWSVPMVEGNRVLCCWSQTDRRRAGSACSLESRNRHLTFSTSRTPAHLRQTPQELLVLLRAEKGRLGDLRVYSLSCPIDAGGQRVVWLEGVDADASVTLLHGLVVGSALAADSRDVVDAALMALALHDNASATSAVAKLAGPGQPDAVRDEAIFWLGEARGRAGYHALDQLLTTDGDPEIQSQIAFALTLSPVPEAIDRLLAMVRDASRPDSVRREALFWLAQSEDDRGLDLIAEILRR